MAVDECGGYIQFLQTKGAASKLFVLIQPPVGVIILSGLFLVDELKDFAVDVFTGESKLLVENFVWC